MGRGGGPIDPSRRPQVRQETKRIETPEGVVVHRRVDDDRPHRRGGPAVSVPDGVTYKGLFPFHGEVTGPVMLFMSYGHLDNDQGPAVIWGDGTVEHFARGRRHAEGKPAVTVPPGIQWLSDNGRAITGPAELWFSDGVLDRSDGPAVTLGDGTTIWYQRGLRHRLGGPAYVSATEISWWHSNKLDRASGPAVVRTNGDLEFYRDGLLDRDDGPAIDHISGRREWWRQGVREAAAVEPY
jgi:hypothetical protein